MPPDIRHIPDPPGIRTARTLPAAWYADPAFAVEEGRAVFGVNWLCAGTIEDLPGPGSWRAVVAGTTPVLLVRDRDGGLRGFLNVCRHRAAPLCNDGAGGSGSVIRCPYHAWIYRLDGSLARAGGVGDPHGFDPADHSLTEVGVEVWRRWVFVHPGGRAVFDLGPLARAVAAFPLEEFELELSESHDRAFNWKVLVENYSENYHTPFVHPEIDASSTMDYPMVSDGSVLYAWDRPLRPASATEVAASTLLPGEPGWEVLGTAGTERPYDGGSYLTIWPNLMLNVFPDAALAMWVEPRGPTSTRVERRLYVCPSMPQARRRSIVAAHRLVHEQDVEICLRVQRSHNAGLDAAGVLATVEERGVHFVHQHLRSDLGRSGSTGAGNC